jgi:cytochrome c biogenesis protein CcdA
MTPPPSPTPPNAPPPPPGDPDDLADLMRTWRDATARLEGRIADVAAALERSQERDVRAERDRVRRRVGRALATVRAFDIAQIVIAAVVAIAAGSFWFDHRDEPSALLSGIALHAYAIAMIAAMARRLVLTAHIDVAGPVLATQTAFARLRRFHIRSSLALGLAWWFLWIPCLIILARVALDVDLYARAPLWFWLSMLVGAAGIVGSLTLARYLVHRAAASPAPAWADQLAGRSLARAGRELAELYVYPHDAG